MYMTVLQHGMGYLAVALVFATFYMRTMIPLRAAAIASNIAFLGYALGFGLWPIAVLHGLLLPLNTLRLVQMRRVLREIATARNAEINVRALAHNLTSVKYTRGAAIFTK